MTNRGLFAVLASTSIGVDLLTEVLCDPSTDTMIGAAMTLVIAAAMIFGVFRDSIIALVGLAIWLYFSVVSSVNDFFPIEALRHVFAPGETIAIKVTNLVTLAILIAALAIYSKGNGKDGPIVT